MDTAEQPGPCNRPTDASSNAPAATKPATSEVKPKLSKGVENAKKRLRAFSIQKKTPITPIVVPKPTSTGHATVLIGKLCGIKPSTPKVDDDQKKQPRPPKPGSYKRPLTDSYIDLQKKTLSEIEDMKRKMELVELGIPLGLICPTSTSEKAMPTKAMPPIKHFLDPAKVDEIIKEAKKARDEGKKYKFDYQKLLPEYDNPFQRKKEEDKTKTVEYRDKDFEREKYKSDRYERRHSDYKREERDRYKHKDKEKGREKSKDRNCDSDDAKKEDKEANVNLNDYLICDSWSLDNEEKASSPRVEEKPVKKIVKHETDTKYAKAITEQVRDSVLKKQDKLKEFTRDSPIRPIKIEKLQPVIDSFKFEIDPNDDEMLDMFDVESGKEKYGAKTKDLSIYSPTDLKDEDYDQDISKDAMEDGNDDTFLESVINEIKQEDMSDDMSQDKGLVEYDSPIKAEARESDSRLSVTPELDEKMKYQQSQRSDYSDGYRSSESGYKTSDTTESGYKSMDSFRLSVEKDLEESMEAKMSKATVDSLETWSFVLKICQPILFRHDKNKCYRETRTEPKLWYTENPKLCNCVKDRDVVYEELNMCKMNLVDRVYGCDQIPDAAASKCRNWYPRPHLCLTETHTVPLSSEWEGDDLSQTACRSNTPLRTEEVLLDREYQRFMKAVWPEVENRNETPRSTTPVKEDIRKKKKDVEVEKEIEAKKKKEEGSSVKKMKQLSSEGWSQELDIEEEIEKSKKMKIDKEKLRKRKRSLSSLSSESEPDAKKTKKMLKKKALKKTKSKSAKKRRIGKQILKKLKEKEKKKRKQSKIETIDDSEDDSETTDRKTIKKNKKKKQSKQKKILKRKKKEESTSSSSSTTESSTDESEKKAKKKAEGKKKEKKRKRKTSTDSAQSEELFDVNILNNIKTERLTDDEKTKSLMKFSPRRQKPREIINVKELQNDFVGNNIHIKKEVTEEYPLSPKITENQKDLTEKEQEKIPSDKNEDVPKITEVIEEDKEEIEIKEPQVEETPSPITIPQTSPNSIPQNMPPIQIVSNIEVIPTISPVPRSQVKPVMEESMSLCSSQESVCSVKMYEKDDSHLRPSSQNSNYSFNDVINASQSGLYCKQIESVVECEENQEYQQDNYEMYEHLAMAYQSDVASQQACPPHAGGEQRIETVVRARSRGEIKCDWRPGLHPHAPHAPHAPHTPHAPRPSRWGLKPVEVNIVLTGGENTTEVPTSQQQQQEQQQDQQQQTPQLKTSPLPSPQPVYKIQSLANRTDTATGNTNGYDEAYMDMYGAADRLQYGDCFSEAQAHDSLHAAARLSTLDARIDHALKNTVLGEVAKEDSPEIDKDAPEKGILVSSGEASRGGKRVSFADGYKPGQDSDVEEPPVKKRRKLRRSGCAWPCPAAHPDHVPLWDALPPPPPPPGSPPPPRAPHPPLHLLRPPPRPQPLALPAALRKLDTSTTLPLFIPSEPPPALAARFP
ncbi:PREDICTED: zinc finger CCCH domain-containing protein 13-like isoform X2 [Papilio polytes]|uniref:zinc finger CCCH domain-containing protein 13-like isoform X2 n=1 Tax=Papilio polytes TaxID=76194 RepID=UPI0006761F44|nr:PREDICTED: zinc finger CCCH domain-containing protein 13-like isoform X2 [Papilio polytes]